jgi:hypothetical protein
MILLQTRDNVSRETLKKLPPKKQQTRKTESPKGQTIKKMFHVKHFKGIVYVLNKENDEQTPHLLQLLKF